MGTPYQESGMVRGGHPHPALLTSLIFSLTKDSFVVSVVSIQELFFHRIELMVSTLDPLNKAVMAPCNAAIHVLDRLKSNCKNRLLDDLHN